MRQWEYEPGKFLNVENTTATNVFVIAKGICCAEALQKEAGEAGYKGLIVTIEALRAILNGYQSIFKIIQ